MVLVVREEIQQLFQQRRLAAAVAGTILVFLGKLAVQEGGQERLMGKHQVVALSAAAVPWAAIQPQIPIFRAAAMARAFMVMQGGALL